jgi:Toastrack DUF4097
MYFASTKERKLSVTKSKLIVLAAFAPILLAAFLSPVSQALQKDKNASAVNPVLLLKRTATRHEVRRFGFGGTLTIVGAPKGSITVEGWPRSEVDLTADLEWQAENEDDLNQLAAVNNFVFDEDTNHLRIITNGTHDRAYLKKAAKNFPKRLLNLPWKIDYRLRVPTSTDVEIDSGHGAISLSGVEGSLRINATEGDAAFTLTGGTLSATIAAGNVNLTIPARSWRGAGAEIRIAAGQLNIDLPAGFNGDIDADILRAGKIVNTYEGLETREKPGITDKVVRARAGAGGAFFRFTVGDGVVNIRKGQ